MFKLIMPEYNMGVPLIPLWFDVVSFYMKRVVWNTINTRRTILKLLQLNYKNIIIKIIETATNLVIM